MSETGYPYWPAKEGHWIKYNVNQIGGIWQKRTRQIPIVWRSPHAVHHIRINWADSPSTHPTKVFNEEFLTNLGDPKGFQLGNIVFTTQAGSEYIGEIGSVGTGWCICPPEPKLPTNPIGNEVLHTNHQVFYPENGKIRITSLITHYYTIAHPGRWGDYDDCFWTSLEECELNGQTRAAYNYVFARGIGLINFWFVAPVKPGPQSVSAGYEYYAIDWSK